MVKGHCRLSDEHSRSENVMVKNLSILDNSYTVKVEKRELAES